MLLACFASLAYMSWVCRNNSWGHDVPPINPGSTRDGTISMSIISHNDKDSKDVGSLDTSSILRVLAQYRFDGHEIQVLCVNFGLPGSALRHAARCFVHETLRLIMRIRLVWCTSQRMEAKNMQCDLPAALECHQSMLRSCFSFTRYGPSTQHITVR